MDKLEQHWKASANREYLGAWDLQIDTKTDGKPVYGEIKATISAINLEEKVVDMDKGGNAKKDCSVIRFKEKLKPMILNSTNKKAISTATGSPVPKYWLGKQIAIYVETGVYMPGTKKADNITTDALRIRPFAPVAPIVYTCADCGASVGENMAIRTQKAYGVKLCKECGIKRAQLLQEEARLAEQAQTAEEITEIVSSTNASDNQDKTQEQLQTETAIEDIPD